MNELKKCPYCCGEETVIGRQTNYAAVASNKAILLKSEPLYHVICLKCGSVLRSYVKNPEKLKINK